MGFTLRAALARLGKQARVTVVELVPQIIQWARGPMAELAAGCLDDPRVMLEMGDVGEVIAEGSGCFDAILLDVDNGPGRLVREKKRGQQQALLFARPARGKGGAAARRRVGGVVRRARSRLQAQAGKSRVRS